MMWHNPGLNQPDMWQWPAHEQAMFKRLVASNNKRLERLSREQLDRMDALAFSVDVDNNNYPDALNEARYCKALLDMVGE